MTVLNIPLVVTTSEVNKKNNYENLHVICMFLNFLIPGALQEWMSVNPLFVAPQEPMGFFIDNSLYFRGVDWYVK